MGGNTTECEIVKRAMSLGYYTIVTDNHEDWSLSPAKELADEGWNISWSDIDTLEPKCKLAGVDGVLAGFSEFRVENMIKLCERLDLPCSLTMKQLAVTRDKSLFKEMCRKHGIPTISEHHISEVNIKFPVIVKPVDRAGSIGINVADSYEELASYYNIALALSPSKNVIVEDFISDGVKVDVYYYVKNHEIFFLGSSDTIMCKGNEGARILQKAWPFKSEYEHQYLKEIDGNVRNMFKNMGINNAYATMSAFCSGGQFYLFEAGFRLSGEMSYHYYEALSGLNYLDSMIKFSMGDKDDAVFHGHTDKGEKCIVLNFFGLDGIVGGIKGLDLLYNNQAVYNVMLYVKERDEIVNATDVFRKIAMITIVAMSQEDLLSTVDEINSNFDICDLEGRSLIYEKVSHKELVQYYDEIHKA